MFKQEICQAVFGAFQGGICLFMRQNSRSKKERTMAVRSVVYRYAWHCVQRARRVSYTQL